MSDRERFHPVRDVLVPLIVGIASVLTVFVTVMTYYGTIKAESERERCNRMLDGYSEFMSDSFTMVRDGLEGKGDAAETDYHNAKYRFYKLTPFLGSDREKAGRMMDYTKQLADTHNKPDAGNTDCPSITEAAQCLNMLDKLLINRLQQCSSILGGGS